MLHIILGILKVIGIILLVIIGLLLLILLAFLFVPVHYRIAGKKMEKVLEGHISVSWLFHLVGMAADYSGKQLTIRLKLLGFTIKRFGGEQSGTGLEGKRTGRTFGKKKANNAASELDDFWKETDDLMPDKAPGKADAEEVEGSSPKDAANMSKVSEIEAQTTEDLENPNTEPDIEKRNQDNPEAEEIHKKSLRKKENELTEKIIWFLHRVIRFIGKVFGFIISLPERILDTWGKLWDILDAGDNAIDKLEKKKNELYKMIKPFLTDNSRALYKRVLAHLLYLWKHYKPRKVQGWVRYGTGAPDVTGQITGVLYMLLPVTAEKFELIPEFTEKIFETDIMIKGHIRACHLIRIAFLLWRDKQLRGLIRRVRAKGGK